MASCQNAEKRIDRLSDVITALTHPDFDRKAFIYNKERENEYKYIVI